MAPTGIQETSHTYHAEADVLSGNLRLPVKQEIQTEALVSLNDRRENHFSGSTTKYSLEGLVSFENGYTHVSGSRSLKNNGWVTLATSVIEGLKVLDVVTVDRVVAQVSTEHPTVDGHVPIVTFLGTQIENLRIGGYPVQVEFDFSICGDKPAGDKPYTSDPGFLQRLEDRCNGILKAAGLPSSLQDEYDKELQFLGQLKAGQTPGSANKQQSSQGNGQGNHKRWGDPGWRAAIQAPPKVRCSLVKSISSTPVSKAFGNVLEIPGFGFMAIADLEVSDYFELTMLNMQMGCIGDGQIKAGNLKSNGQTAP